jgi:hypothetical protein
VNGKFKDFNRADLLAEASRFGVGTAPEVLGQVREALSGWQRFAEAAEVSATPAAEIEAQFTPL